MQELKQRQAVQSLFCYIYVLTETLTIVLKAHEGHL